MALEKQVLGLNFSQGLSTRQDPKLLLPGKWLDLQNVALSGDNTLTRLDFRTSIQSDIKLNSMAARKQEPLGMDGRALYSFDESNKKLIPKGTLGGVTVARTPLFKVGTTVGYVENTGADIAFVQRQAGSLTCQVWTEAALTGGAHGVYYQVMEESSGTILQGPALASSTAGYGSRVVATSDAFFIFYTQGDNKLWCRVIQHALPTAIGAATTLRTDLATNGAIDATSGIEAYSSFSVGTACYVVYASNDATNSVRAISVNQTAGTPGVLAGPLNVELVANITAAQVSSLVITPFPGSLLAVGILALTTAARPGLVTAVITTGMAISVAAAQKDATAAPTNGLRVGMSVLTGVLNTAGSGVVFYSDRREQCGNGPATPFSIRTTTISNANAITAGPSIWLRSSIQASGVNGPWLAGKAFTSGEHSYVPLMVTGSTGGSQLQNTWFLADESGQMCGRALYSVAGADPGVVGAMTGLWSLLPSSTPKIDSDGFKYGYATLAREQVPGLVTTNFGGSVPTVNTISIAGLSRLDMVPATSPNNQNTFFQPMFAECAESTFFADAKGSCYTGLNANSTAAVSEGSFLLFPEIVVLSAGGAGGTLVNGSTYGYQVVYEWYDGAGQRHQSAPSVLASFAATGTGKIIVTAPSLQTTDRANVSLAVYRTDANGTLLKRITGPLSTAFSNDKTASVVTFTDDGSAVPGEVLYTAAGELGNDGPGPMSMACIHQGRVLGDVTDDPYAFQFSKAPIAGFGLQWSTLLRGRVTPQLGKITGVASMDDRAILFRERGISVMTGQCPSASGLGGSLIVQDIPTDVGCSDARSTLTLPPGVVFKSFKGWYLLMRGLQVKYIGEGVKAWDYHSVRAAVLMGDRQECRFTLNAAPAGFSGLQPPTLIWNYQVDYGGQADDSPGEWSYSAQHRSNTWSGAVWVPGPFNWNGIITYPAGAYYTAINDLGVDLPVPGIAALEVGFAPVPTVLQTGWLRPGNALEGFQRARWLTLTGGMNQTASTTPGTTLRLDVYVNYDIGSTPVQTVTVNTNDLVNVAPGASVPSWQWRVHLAQQKCQAIMFKLTESGTGTGSGLNYSGMSLEVGVKRGVMKLPAVQSS